MKLHKELKSITTFDIILVVLLLLVSIIMIFPVWSVLMTSLVSNTEFFSRPIILWPERLNFSAYKAVFATPQLMKAMGITSTITLIGTIFSMLLTVSLAYGLSKRRLMGQRIFLAIIIFTMYFSGGIIPYYLLIKNLGLRNSIWVMIIPAGINVWNFIVVKSFFVQLPESLEESAKLDGANDIQILIKIMLPLSTPVLAAFALFYGVDYWNTWWSALLFISDRTLYPLQLVLREMVIKNASLEMASFGKGTGTFEEGIKMATVVIATLPILCVYPFLQKYFVKGVMLGAVKG